MSITPADDFKTINGKEYKDATVSRVEPDGIVLKTKSGISKVYFTELPKEVQERFLPSPAKTGAAQRELIELKSWVAAMANSTFLCYSWLAGLVLLPPRRLLSSVVVFNDKQRCEKNLSEILGKSSLTISRKPVGVGAASQRLISKGERSGLLTHIAATESVSLCVRMNC